MLSAKARRRLGLLGIAAVVIAVTLVAIWAVRKHQIRQAYAQYRLDGLAAANSGNDSAALELLGKYLARHPADVEALVAYAGARRRAPLPDNAHLAQTIQILRHILRIDPTRDPQRRELLELCLRAGMHPEALAVADELLAKDPTDADALRTRAVCLLAMGRRQDAAQAARSWADADLHNVEAHLLVIELLAQGEAESAALEYAASLSTRGLPDLAGKLLLGLGQLRVGKLDQARTTLLDLASQKPCDKTIALRLTHGLEALGLTQQALNVLQNAAANAPNDLELQTHWLRSLWQSGDMDAFVRALGQPISAPPARWAEQTALKVVALRKLNRQAEAAALAETLRSQPDELTSAWLAATDILAGQRLDPADAASFKQRCTAALNADPGNPFLAVCLGEALSSLGEHERALAQFDQVARGNPAWIVPLLRVAEVQLMRGNLEQAMNATSAALARAPNNVRVASMLANVWDAAIESGKRDDVGSLLRHVERIQQAVPGEPSSLGVYLRRLAEAGRAEQARAALAGALDATQSQSAAAPAEPLLLNWAQISHRWGLGLEQQCIQRCQQIHGITPRSAFLEAYFQFESGQPQAGWNHLQTRRAAAGSATRSTSQPSDEAEWDLAEARYLDLMRSPLATERWVMLSQRYPTSISVQRAVLSSPTVSGDRHLQDLAIERLRQAAGENSPLWKLPRARWLLGGQFSQADARSAADLLAAVIDAWPESAEPRFLLAQCFQRLGQLPQAIEQINRASRLAPDSPAIALYAAHLLQQAGDYASARQHLDRVLNSPPDDPQNRRRAAVLLAQQGELDHAAQLLQQDLGQSRESDILLAESLLRGNQLEQAEQIAARLLQTAGTDPAVIRLAADIYWAMGRPDDARAVIARLDNAAADHATKAVLRAQFHSKTGDVPTAIQILRSAAAQSPQSPQLWRALATHLLLQQQHAEAIGAIEQGLRHLPDDPSLKAILSRGSLIAAAVEHAMLPLAIALMNNPDDSAAADAVTQLTAPDASDPARMIVYLTQLGDRHPRSLPVQIVVIDRLLMFNRPQQAAALAGRAAQAFPFSEEPPRLATRAYAAMGDWSQVAAMARTWRKRAGASVQADLALAAAMRQSGQTDAAIALLQPYLRLLADNPRRHADAAQAVTQYGLLLCQAGRASQCERELAPLLADRGSPLFAAFYPLAAAELPAQQLQPWLDRLGGVSAGDSLEVALTVAATHAAVAQRADYPAREQHRELAGRLFAELAARPDLPPQHLLTIALHLETLGDLAAAEPLYRRLARENDPQAIAANNLAMILARRGELSESLSLAQLAVKTNPRAAFAHDTLGFVHRARGELPAAVAALRNAVRLEPASIEWRLRLAELLLDSNAASDAQAQLSALHALAPDPQRLSDDQRQRLEAIARRIEQPTATAAADTSASQRDR
ncbi:tetratricopeptide repeat protein [Fontivita pretiosa]|uniref:tetratricopeptide repeat protein n=1 Tax=Fontivita pretiosa TaxID=2989684 RepID=UPI003D16F4C6